MTKAGPTFCKIILHLELNFPCEKVNARCLVSALVARHFNLLLPFTILILILVFLCGQFVLVSDVFEQEFGAHGAKAAARMIGAVERLKKNIKISTVDCR
jgi:hypothetical protein